VKSAIVMEQLGQTTQVAFDKTGTLTQGTPHVTGMQDAAFRADYRNQLYAPQVEAISRLVNELAGTCPRLGRGPGWLDECWQRQELTTRIGRSSIRSAARSRTGHGPIRRSGRC